MIVVRFIIITVLFVIALTAITIWAYKRRNKLVMAGAAVVWYIALYGTFLGFQKLEVNHHTYTSASLPKAFDGYKIVLFSDAHVGSYSGMNRRVLQCAIDSINAQHPDMIVFTGDLQNVKPEEILQHENLLKSLKAKDGVYSVLGNHDYDKYLYQKDGLNTEPCRETIALEKRMGWHLMQNEHHIIKRGNDSITIAGMDNDGDGKRFPQRGNVKKALRGATPFVIMLEHDPSAWRRKIVPDGRAQLTLSGHTHNMQFALFGWSPMKLSGKEINGWYTEGKQSLFVTAGLGGLIPFRFGATGEIVVLKLKLKE